MTTSVENIQNALNASGPAVLQIPDSQNKTRLSFERGFWDAMQTQAEAAWPMALTAIAEATGASLEAVRLFLDSRYGSRFAKNVCGRQRYARETGRRISLSEAIDQIVDDWITIKIDSDTAAYYGIPCDLPYLTGWVWHYELELEKQAG